MTILELVGLRKQFGELAAVDDIDLAVEEGEIRGLIGPNGSGKTTLFNVVSGFLNPTRGRVIFQGHDIGGQSANATARQGLVRTFQLTTLFKDMTALQNVVMASHLHTGTGLAHQFLRGPRTRRKERDLEKNAVELLETMGIAHVKDDAAGQLPHGYQRALGIAVALAARPRLLLLDEPVSGMNPSEKADMMERIKKLRDEGITILLVEHDMKAVMSTCEKIAVMNFGKKIAEGTPEEVSKHEEVIEAYLGRE